MASSNDLQLALRIPAELMSAIDAEVERVKGQRPGARVQRSDVVREVLMRAFFNHPPSVSALAKRETESASDERPSLSMMSRARHGDSSDSH